MPLSCPNQKVCHVLSLQTLHSKVEFPGLLVLRFRVFSLVVTAFSPSVGFYTLAVGVQANPPPYLVFSQFFLKVCFSPLSKHLYRTIPLQSLSPYVYFCSISSFNRGAHTKLVCLLGHDVNDIEKIDSKAPLLISPSFVRLLKSRSDLFS